MRRSISTGLAVASLLASAPASAHAIIIAAQPGVGATVAGPNLSVDLRFNSRIDHLRSRVWLTEGDKPIPVKLDTEGAPDHLTGAVATLQPGDYVLHWQVLAVDGHITRGDIPFHVATP